MTKPDSAVKKSGPYDELVERIARRVRDIADDYVDIDVHMSSEMATALAREIAGLVEAAVVIVEDDVWEELEIADPLRAALRPWVGPTK